MISTLLITRSVANIFIATEEELSEEDQQLKNDLDMLVERLTVRSFARLIKEFSCANGP